MRIHNPLDDILKGKGALRVLRVLSRYPGSTFSARDLARMGGLSLSHVQGVLAALEGEGIIQRQVAGHGHMWSIVTGNAMLPSLQRLFDHERKLEEALMADLARGLRGTSVRRAVVFGSVARDEEKGWSDVDLMVEVKGERDREKVADALFPLSDHIRERFGLNLAPIVVTPSEVRSSLSRSFLKSVNRDGKVVGEVP